jgi:hypothetical protein
MKNADLLRFWRTGHFDHPWVPEHKTSSSASPLSLPISPPTAALGTLALQKLHRICQAEVRTLKARYTLATVKLALSKYRERDPRRGPRSLGLAPKKNAFRSALQLSRARTGRNPLAGTPFTTSASSIFRVQGVACPVVVVNAVFQRSARKRPRQYLQ